ncbi:MAG: hypothetical protein JXQ90_15070 [Cyclobacteriaceae bacterium]
MYIHSNSFLRRTYWRDLVSFFLYSLLVTLMFQFSSYEVMKWDLSRITLVVIMIAQFYLTAYMKIPFGNLLIRRVLLGVFHVVNFFLFRELVLALTPYIVIESKNFEWLLIVFFLLVVLGRGVMLYTVLVRQLEVLELWSQRKILFEKPEKMKVHLGEPGMQSLHPNEILYIRTKEAGDHTKIFGVKSKENNSFQEYSTTHYKNFKEVDKLLSGFKQFKRVSQSTIVNFKYPFEERNGSVLIEGRRFAMSNKYYTKS